MKILVSGPGGLIGKRLLPALAAAGHLPLLLSRSAGPGRVTWDPEAGRLSAADLAGIDGVIHLAGEGIAEGRWTPARKAAIRSSRILGTRLLAQTAAGLPRRPGFFITASALGWYGDRGDEILTESASPGTDFLAGVCREWEAAAEPARAAGIRTAALRIGLVLTPEGGALKQMLLTFRLGLGGPLGDGRQYWSWITLDDVVGALLHVVRTESLAGPVNGVTGSVTNREFTRTLNRVLGRSNFLAVPGFALRILMGEMADALLLSSARIEPVLLPASGYRWRDPELEPALRRLLRADLTPPAPAC